MNNYLKKISAFCVGITALMTMASSVHAQGYGYGNYGGYYPYNNCNPCCPPPCNPCCPAPCNPCCPPPCNPCCPPPCNPCCPPPCCPESCFWIKGEGLYTRACDNGLAFADKENRNTAGRTKFRDKFVHPHFDWDWGYRGSLGIRFCECWELSGSYTHFKNEADGCAHNCKNEVTFPIYGFFIDQFANVHAEYDLKIDYIDINISRKFDIGGCVCLKPNFGAKLARIKQHFKVHNHFASFPLPLITDSLRECIHMNNKFEGGGIKAGLDGIWGLGCGLSLVSSADGAILFGHKHYKFKDHVTTKFFNGFTFHQHDSFKDDSCTCRYVADLAASLRWEGSCGCNILGLEAGYEGHFFFNMDDFVNELDANFSPSLAQGSRTDLCVHGGRFAAYLRF